MINLKMKSISLKLFKVYAIFFSMFFSALLIFYIVYVGSQLNKNIIQTQAQTQKSINQIVENFFTNTDEFAVTLINSREFKEIATKELPYHYEQYGTSGNYFNDLYRVAYQMMNNGFKIGIHTKNNRYIWMGNNYFINEIDSNYDKMIKEFTTLDVISVNVFEENAPLVKSLEKYPHIESEIEKMVCISRPIMQENTFNVPVGILEIQVPYIRFERLIETIVSETINDSMKLAVYNKQGDKLYGDLIRDENLFLKNQSVISGKFSDKGITTEVSPIMRGNLYVVSEVTHKMLYSSFSNYIIISLSVFVLLNLLLMLITYKISNQITKPVKVMCHELENIKFANPENVKKLQVDTDILEINVLGNTIADMQLKLSNSISEIISLKSYELQSKLLALQAQMQPHFLYNTLTTIAAMAEEKEADNVAKICGNLTEMLRYISTESTDRVSVSEELIHLDHYIKIMNERFPKLKVKQNIPLSMLSIRLPKLVIQPLVENSMKYCLNDNTIITVSGTAEDGHWKIIVSDNGVGFTESKINEIMQKCGKYSKDYRQSSLTIDGMGLVNIYIRLKLCYGDDSVFNISNNDDSGCSVTIGGLI